MLNGDGEHFCSGLDLADLSGYRESKVRHSGAVGQFMLRKGRIPACSSEGGREVGSAAIHVNFIGVGTLFHQKIAQYTLRNITYCGSCYSGAPRYVHLNM